jgi:ABC-type lipoprotein export system ATPase subunit
MTPVVRCVAATREFAAAGSMPVRAVDAVDLEIAPGEFAAIEGPSGSGKTTLLGLLAGIDRADAGTVTVLGHDLARLSATERARLRRSSMGVVFQAFGLVSSLSAEENVALPLTLARVPRAERLARAAAALADVGLEGFGSARIDELSGGERQRVGVARALVAEPALILADEPAGSLDDENASHVLDLLYEASRTRGASLVLVTHDRQSAARADRRVRMRDGRFVSEATDQGIDA